MSNASIWIRKSNQARWDALSDKSAWVNQMLARKTYWQLQPGDEIKTPVGPAVVALAEELPEEGVSLPYEEEATQKRITKALDRVYAQRQDYIDKNLHLACKHGFHPDYCKYSRPGKPCKK